MESEGGFSLLETLVATSLLVVGVGALVQLVAISTRANDRARAITTAALLAESKTEQLRALTWGFDPAGLPVSDTSTDTRTVPESPEGGTGLRSSPPGALTTNTAGYCDFLDGSGRSLPSAGTRAPDGARFVRRWSISALPSDPDNAIVIQVIVTPSVARRAGESSRVVAVRTRRSAP